jgi:hypothetical protein
MDINISGNPGTGNSFTEIHIGNVQNYNPSATTVINHNYGSRVKSLASQEADEPDKTVVRPKIIQYVEKTLDYVTPAWKNRFRALWEEILSLKAVDAEVYRRGEQQGTLFNRVLVAGIIRVLKDHDVYVKCTNTALAIALENNEEHHVRQEIGRYPSNEICDAVKNLLKRRQS